jgi:hypothetical protein
MTRKELDAALARLGLNVPETERDEILVKKPRWVGAEPAHTVAFPEKK